MRIFELGELLLLYAACGKMPNQLGDNICSNHLSALSFSSVHCPCSGTTCFRTGRTTVKLSYQNLKCTFHMQLSLVSSYFNDKWAGSREEECLGRILPNWYCQMLLRVHSLYLPLLSFY